MKPFPTEIYFFVEGISVTAQVKENEYGVVKLFTSSVHPAIDPLALEETVQQIEKYQEWWYRWGDDDLLEFEGQWAVELCEKYHEWWNKRDTPDEELCKYPYECDCLDCVKDRIAEDEVCQYPAFCQCSFCRDDLDEEESLYNGEDEICDCPACAYFNAAFDNQVSNWSPRFSRN